MNTVLIVSLLGLLFADPSTTSWWIEKAWWAIAAITVIGLALIILLSKKREDVQMTETKRADANEKLVKTRDIQIADLEKQLEEKTEQCAEKTEDFDSIAVEYKTLAGINIKALLEFWAERDRLLAENADLKEDNRIYKRRIGPNK